MHLYPIDGAMHRVRPDETAFSYRECTGAQVIVDVEPDPTNNFQVNKNFKPAGAGTAQYVSGYRGITIKMSGSSVTSIHLD